MRQATESSALSENDIEDDIEDLAFFGADLDVIDEYSDSLQGDEDIFWLYPENAVAYEAFIGVIGQWSYRPDGSLSGLRYEACIPFFQLKFGDQALAVFEDVCHIEAGVLLESRGIADETVV